MSSDSEDYHTVSFARPLTSAFLVLVTAFAMMSFNWLGDFFKLIALSLAISGEMVLGLIGDPVLRTGTELRNLANGWAINVTEVCDGHGIIFAWIAVIVGTGFSWRKSIILVAVGFCGIQLFNLIRIITLGLTIPAGGTLFDTVHLFTFPLLTSGLVSVMLLFALRLPFRRGLIAAILSLILSFGWLKFSEPVAATIFVTPINAILQFVGPNVIGVVAERGSGWTVGTNLIASIEPLRLYLAQFYPPDFLIFVPVVFAAILIKPRLWQYWFVGVFALLLALGAAVLGTVTATWSVVDTFDVTNMVVTTGEGLLRAELYSLPSDNFQAVIRLTQNIIVHLNLLVLPAILLTADRDSAHAN